MKTTKMIMLCFMLGLFSTSGFISCTKTNTVIKRDTVIKNVPTYLDRQTLILSPSKDASIFLEDTLGNHNGVPPQYGDNGSGASDLLRVGYSDQNSYFVRTLVMFDVSTIPSNAIIDKVTLSFTMGKSGSQLVDDTISVYKLTQNWTEGTSDEGCSYGYSYCSDAGLSIEVGNDVTWNQTSYGGTAWTTPGGSFASTASATVNNGGVPTFSSQGLIDDVTAWRASSSLNFGWILKVRETHLHKSGGEQLRYYSREASTAKAGRSTSGSNTVAGAEPSTKPTLTIIYH